VLGAWFGAGPNYLVSLDQVVHDMEMKSRFTPRSKLCSLEQKKRFVWPKMALRVGGVAGRSIPAVLGSHHSLMLESRRMRLSERV